MDVGVAHRVPNVALVAMPWSSLYNPSIQLGLLVEVARAAGAKAVTRHYNLAFADYLARQAVAQQRRFSVADYMQIGIGHTMSGLGDWIFAVPPFRDHDLDADTRYFRELAQRGSPEPILELASWVRGHVPMFLAACVDELLAMDVQVFGFTTGFSQTVASLALTKVLKARAPNACVIFGGADCDGPMGEGLIQAFDWIDAIVQGEGEPVLPGLLHDLARYGAPRPQPGLCLRRAGGLRVGPRPAGGRVVLDETPIPDYSEYFSSLHGHALSRDISAAAEITVESSRGCWWGQKHHCTFCGYNGDEMKFRSKSPDRMLGEFEELARRSGRLRFMMTDAILDQAFFHSVIPRLAAGDLDLQVFYETKANLRRDQVSALRDAGVVHIQPGIESLDSRILQQMRKGTTALINIRMLKYCFEHGINTLWNIIHGFPGEDEQAYERMATLVRALTHLQPPSLVRLVLDRFSPYQRDPAAFGLEIDGPPFYYPLVFPDRPEVREQFMNISYRFEYHHVDGRDPDAYVGSLRGAIERWQQVFRPERTALRHARGPGFVNIIDERADLPRGSYRLEDWQADAYLACDAGATAKQVVESLASRAEPSPTLAQVTTLFEELSASALMFEEDGRYLSLSISSRRRYPFVLLEA